MINGHGDDLYQYSNIKMNFSSNICPAKEDRGLRKCLTDAISLIGHYPEPEAWSLEQLIAQKERVDPRCVLVTSGATEAIYLIAQAFPIKPRIMTPTFTEYADALRIFPSEGNRKHALWLCNPNNPDGKMYSRQEIISFSTKYDLLVIDQSYEHYTQTAGITARDAVNIGKVIQIHSLTKTYAVPGLRIGYIIATASIIKTLRHFIRPWAVNTMAIEAGKYLITHGKPVSPDFEEAQRLREKLMEIEGINVEETQTTFMLCHIQQKTAAELKEYLAQEHGMLIRNASNFHGLNKHHFRVASQSRKENNQLVKAIKMFL